MKMNSVRRNTARRRVLGPLISATPLGSDVSRGGGGGGGEEPEQSNSKLPKGRDEARAEKGFISITLQPHFLGINGVGFWKKPATAVGRLVSHLATLTWLHERQRAGSRSLF